MSLSKAIFLGIIQGLTEFLPVSSSGHLVIAQHLLPGFRQPGVAFDVTLHLATLLAVVVFFRREIRQLVSGLFSPASTPAGRRQRHLLFLLVVGTIPTGVIGVAGKKIFVSLFENITLVGVMLLVTALLLLLADRVRRQGKTIYQANGLTAAVIGIVQGLAIIPGISRSGSTIAAGLLLGLDGQDAARFSFLLSIPAILGAVVLSFPDMARVGSGELPAYLAGGLAALVTGLASLKMLLLIINKHQLKMFAWYCLAVGSLVLLYW